MCTFPAMKLLQARHAAVQTMNPYDAFPVVREIDERRWKHFEETGCNCWHEAREVLDAKTEGVAA